MRQMSHPFLLYLNLFIILKKLTIYNVYIH